MINSRRHSVQKQLVLINELNQVAWIADLTTEVGLVWGAYQVLLHMSLDFKAFSFGLFSIFLLSLQRPRRTIFSKLQHFRAGPDL